ncbi:MAG: peptidyl-alpha-hydroxyglycine alpha-amidating lyase family protein [Bryobacteraceae bacterium]
MQRLLVSLMAAAVSIAPAAELKSGPPLPHQLVKDWPKLPPGWNFGECSGVSVDKDDHVWVFNRGLHPVMEFDRDGKFIQGWPEVVVKSSHGIKVDDEGNVWGIDVKGHLVVKYTRQGRVQMVLGRSPGNNDSKYEFNEPTGIAFTPGGEFYVSDGYVNSRVIKFNRDGEYLTHWGKKGAADGEFNLSHDVALDGRGRVYVADRTNERVQVFDANGKFLSKWTGLGAPWGLAYSRRDNSIFMADGLNNRVLKLNLDGQILGVLGSFGKAPGKFDFAHHIAVDSAGAVYVAEIKNWRVQKFAPR